MKPKGNSVELSTFLKYGLTEVIGFKTVETRGLIPFTISNTKKNIFLNPKKIYRFFGQIIFVSSDNYFFVVIVAFPLR